MIQNEIERLPKSATPLLVEHEVARLLNMKVDTIRHWRVTGRGPAYIKAGPGRSAVRYSLADIDAWIAAQRVVGGR